ncbi:hypothetical protein [Abyssisolibacter fermentans]|nr:hypothetical protein [Abyssisolibacter fermentans]
MTLSRFVKYQKSERSVCLPEEINYMGLCRPDVLYYTGGPIIKINY